MYKNRTPQGELNISGKRIRELRLQLSPRTSQRALADRLLMNGLDLDKNAIQKIERGQRFVTDIELKVFAEVLNTSTDYLLGRTEAR